MKSLKIDWSAKIAGLHQKVAAGRRKIDELRRQRSAAALPAVEGDAKAQDRWSQLALEEAAISRQIQQLDEGLLSAQATQEREQREAAEKARREQEAARLAELEQLRSVAIGASSRADKLMGELAEVLEEREAAILGYLRKTGRSATKLVLPTFVNRALRAAGLQRFCGLSYEPIGFRESLADQTARAIPAIEERIAEPAA